MPLSGALINSTNQLCVNYSQRPGLTFPKPSARALLLTTPLPPLQDLCLSVLLQLIAVQEG